MQQHIKNALDIKGATPLKKVYILYQFHKAKWGKYQSFVQ
jgi:hypothetical protein